MRLDDEVKKKRMISAESPVLLAKAAEIFIAELTKIAWIHTTEGNKNQAKTQRRTLQRRDIVLATKDSNHFDFLIDIVPNLPNL